jgi:hypothetical protein
MKNVLLGSSALICLSLLNFSAEAACTTTAPTTGQTVDCTGTSTTPVVVPTADTKNVTITLENGARLNTAATAVEIEGGNTIHLLGDAQINTTGDYHDGILSLNETNDIDLNGTAKITTTGQRSAGIVSGRGEGKSTVTLNGQAQIDTTGIGAHGITVSDDDVIKLNDTSQINLAGDFAHGIDTGGDHFLIQLNGGSSIVTAGKRGYGIRVNGYQNQVELNDTSYIKTSGVSANGMDIRDGGNGTITLNGHSHIQTTGGGAGIYTHLSGNNVISLNDDSSIQADGFGFEIRSDGNQLRINDRASVTTTGANAYGALLSGNHNSLTLNGTTANISTTGASAHAVRVNGDDDSITLNGGTKLSTTGVAAFGVRGTGDRTSVRINDTAQIRTTGAGSVGVSLTGAGESLSILGTHEAGVYTKGDNTNSVNITGDGGAVYLGGSSYIKNRGLGGVALNITGDGSVITLNGGGTGNAYIYAEKNNSKAIQITGGNATISLKGSSFVFAASNNTTGGTAIVTTAGNNKLLLDGNGLVQTNGDTSNAVVLGGDNNIIRSSGHGEIETSGNGSNGVVALGTHNQISLNDASAIVTFGDTQNAIQLGQYGSVFLNDGSILRAGISGHQPTDASLINLIGDHGTVAMTGSALINAYGLRSSGIIAAQSNDAIGLYDQAQIQTNGATAHGILVKATSNSDIITLNGASQITTSGAGADGIDILGASNFVFLRDTALIHATGAGAFGIDLAGGSNNVSLDGHARITSDTAAAIHTVAGGNFNRVFMNDQSSVAATAAATPAIQFNSNGNILEMKDDATLSASGNGSNAVLLGNSNLNFVFLNDRSSISTTGDNSITIGVVGSSNQLELLQGTRVTATGAGSSAISLSGANNTLTTGGTVSASNGIAIIGDNNAANRDDVTNTGLISSGGGNSPITLLAGDDFLNLGTGSQIIGGPIDGGAGNDELTLFGTSSEAEAFTNFEILTVQQDVNSQQPTNWSLSGTSTFATKIDIKSGRLAVNGDITSPVTTISDPGILGGNGILTSNVTSTGTIAAGNSVGTLTINGNLTQTGGSFDVEVDKSGVDRVNVLGAGGATLAGNPTLNIIPLDGTSGGAGTILHATNGITGSFAAPVVKGNVAVDLTQSATDINLIVVNGTPLVGSDFAASETGLDYLDSVGDEQLAGLRDCGTDSCDSLAAAKHLWAKGFGRFGAEAAGDGNQAFDFRIAGTALGGDMQVTDGLRLGAAFGYGNTDETVSHDAASADINTTQASLYANYQKGPYFITGQISGGWQSFDLSRQVGGGKGEADASTNAWLFGTSVQAGAQFRFPQGWKLKPSAGISYQHQWVDGYSEHGGGAADAKIAGHQADALRLKAQLELSQDYQLTGYTITPHAKVGVQQQFNMGGKADGTFSDGNDFSLDLIKTDRTIGVAGVGVDLGFQNGLTTYVDYDAALASGRTVQSVTGGLRYSW